MSDVPQDLVLYLPNHSDHVIDLEEKLDSEPQKAAKRSGFRPVKAHRPAEQAMGPLPYEED